MKKLILFVLFPLICGEAAAQGYGVCMAQDQQHVYVAGPEFESFVVMDKETESLTFYNAKNSTLDWGGYNHLINGIAAEGGKVWISAPINFLFEDDTFVPNNQYSGNGTYRFTNLMYNEACGLWALNGSSMLVELDEDLSIKNEYSIESERYRMKSCKRAVMTPDGEVWAFGVAYDNANENKDTYVLVKFSDGQFTLYPQENTAIYGIDVDQSGKVWFLTNKFGLMAFDGENIVSTITMPENTRMTAAADMKFDASGRLWILYNDQLLCMENGEFKSYAIPETYDLTRMLSLSVDGNDVRAIAYYFIHKVNPATGKADGYGAHHARAILYTFADDAVKVKEIVPTVSNPTGVNAIALSGEETPVVYDLQGRRLAAAPRHGVCLVNGKKVMR